MLTLLLVAWKLEAHAGTLPARPGGGEERERAGGGRPDSARGGAPTEGRGKGVWREVAGVGEVAASWKVAAHWEAAAHWKAAHHTTSRWA